MVNKFNYCVDCGVFFKPLRNSILLVKEKDVMWRGDLYWCEKCGKEIIPADCLGNPQYRFENPENFDYMVNHYGEKGDLYYVE